MQNNTNIINKGTDDELICTGYRSSRYKLFLYYLCCILSAGILIIVLRWKDTWALKFRMRKCSLETCEYVLLENTFGQHCVLVVNCETIDESYEDSVLMSHGGSTSSLESSVEDVSALLTKKPERMLRYFVYAHLRYVWTNDVEFTLLSGLDKDTTCAMLHDDFNGLTDALRAYRLSLYGENSIDIELKSYPKLFIEEIFRRKDGSLDRFIEIKTTLAQIRRVFNPFYVFQICSVVIWCSEDYYVYAGCIVFISLLSLGTSLYETSKQSKTLHDMIASHNTEQVQVYTDNREGIQSIAVNRLVTGDLLLLPSDGFTMPCDAVLISGNAIVNESMLTGESVPVTKTPVAPSEAAEHYDSELHRRHTLFSGTRVIQTRFYGEARVYCVVSSTGFSTAKGELVRSILNPRPVGMKFYKDSLKFIGCLAVIASVGMAYSIYNFLQSNATIKVILLRGLDIITVVVPPALPAAMTVGTVYAQNRLKKKGVFCISPARINVCGKLKLICFDKTGTLTEEGLDIWGVVPTLKPPPGDTAACFTQTGKLNPSLLDDDEPIKIAMATCHSLTLIDDVLTGDPLDLTMFESIKWTLEEPGAESQRFDSLIPTIVRPASTIRDSYDSYAQNRLSNIEVGVVRQFTFSSHLQRMSVITRQLGAPAMCFNVKGAPEVIVKLCNQDSVPADFHAQLRHYTMKGYRVIAFANKMLDAKLSWLQVHKVKREKLEVNLQFLGLLVMENTLKPQTTPVISELKQADIRTVMVTGDNILTAISVARQCSMIDADQSIISIEATPPSESDSSNQSSVSRASITWSYVDEDTGSKEAGLRNGVSQHMKSYQQSATAEYKVDVLRAPYHFAIDGTSFGVIFKHFPHLVDKICVRGTVFARMSPDQKTLLVESLQNLGYTVGMCGDGANDCGALKAADAGISLSDAEASVASPFTSNRTDITCVPTVIREGRAALVTSFGVFKYMALYSLIQFVSLLILYTEMCNLSDIMFLYIDLVITTTVAIFMGHSNAYHRLAVRRPTGSLFSCHNIVAILAHVVIVTGFQLAAFDWLTHQSWYSSSQTLHPSDSSVVLSYETTTIFTVSAFQYLTLAFAYSKGPPYREPIWKNKLFLFSLILICTMTTVISLVYVPYVTDLLELITFPDFKFSLSLIGISAANFFVSVFIESVVIESSTFKYIINCLRRKKDANSKNRYKQINRLLEDDTIWPPIGTISYA